MTSLEKPCYEFGRFRLDASQRLLFREEQIVSLSPKSLEILVLLVEKHGQLVEKDELMKSVWPDCFVEESNLAVNISQLRKTLAEDAGFNPIETIPRRGYRFRAPVREVRPTVNEVQPAASSVSEPRGASKISEARTTESTSRPGWQSALRVVIPVLALGCIGWVTAVRWHGPARAQLTPSLPAPALARVLAEKDTVIVADIQNDTGQAVFDGTLRQALSIQLEQSPFLNLVSDQRIGRSLQMMGKPANAHLTPDLAWEVCERTGSIAVIYGSIANLDNQYVLGLRAMNCRTGDALVNQQTTVDGKANVLKAVDQAATRVRGKLGESLATMQRYSTPIEEASTPSLDALQAYSLGRVLMVRKSDSVGAVPFFERAIHLDPRFAMAYAALGNAYSNLNEVGRARENLQSAYNLRGHVSDRERFYIESHYHHFTTGDLEQARRVYQTWAETYPTDVAPRTNLAVIDSFLGQHERSLEESRVALQLSPEDAQSYANLVDAYLFANRLEDAKSLAREAQAKNLDSPDLRQYLYVVAYLQKDEGGMQRQVAWAQGQPGVEDVFQEEEAEVAADRGNLKGSRELSRRAVAGALRADEKETAATYEVNSALREALFQNAPEAKQHAEAALRLAQDRDTRYGASLALALSGEAIRAQELANALEREYPQDTAVQLCYVPTIGAAVFLNRGDAAKAIDMLERVRPYESGAVVSLYPAYLRSGSYAQLGKNQEAAAELQKIVNNSGVVGDDPIGVLAVLAEARTFAALGDKSQAEKAYGSLLAQWKNADDDLQLLGAAQSESAHLQ
jgi:eukaryotic-like serine/threonine-protein kinase